MHAYYTMERQLFYTPNTYVPAYKQTAYARVDLTPQDAIQTFLFSATMPGWIKSICQRFLRPNHAFCDLVGDDKNTQVRL